LAAFRVSAFWTAPSIIGKDDFRRIWQALEPMLKAEDLYECTIEIDPRYEMTPERMRFYHDMGVDRISFGVQDFNAQVGKIINRVNPPEMLEQLLTRKNLVHLLVCLESIMFLC